MRKYKLIRSAMIDEKHTLLLRNFKNGMIDSMCVMNEMSELEFEEPNSEDYSMLHTIKGIFPDYEKSPSGGDWLIPLSKEIQFFHLAHIAAIDRPEITFKDQVVGIFKSIKNFDILFSTNEEKDTFWKIVGLLSMEFER